LVVGADTAVVDGGELLGKPADAAMARTMLRGLRGHSHQVYTGIAVLRPRDGRLVTDLCVTDVPMRSYSDEEIESYVRSGDPLDKAGAYGIQHPAFDPVRGMAGCYASVMGLPVCHLVRTLRQFEAEPAADVPLSCQRFLRYDCPISPAVLRGEQVG
jgi:MAF protein